MALRRRNRNDFWSDFFAKWWVVYPWKLGDKEEPPLNDPVKMADLAFAGAAEMEAKSEIETKLVAVCF